MSKPLLSDTVFGWLKRKFRSSHSPLSARRGPRTHVIVLDGTMSSLKPGEESNAGLAYRLLQQVEGLSLYYEAGIQWTGWLGSADVMMGRGINRQIRRAYGFLASRYRPGDRIYLLGYSRGAFAVRSLAGVIDSVGLLRPEHAAERNVRQAYRLYQYSPGSHASQRFARAYCHSQTQIEMIGVWDTVKALGLRVPFLWRFTEPAHAFHSHQMAHCVKNGFQALASDETRRVYEPVLWRSTPGWQGRLEQVWFPGAHSDVGGQLGGYEAARPLSNLSLVWMLERLEECGIDLPAGWQNQFPTDPLAPSIGTWRGSGKFFFLRKGRRVGDDPSEMTHDSVKIRLLAAGGRLSAAKSTENRNLFRKAL